MAHQIASSHDVDTARRCQPRRWRAPVPRPGRRENARSPESLSYEAHAHCLLRGLELPTEASDRCWAELVEILEGCSRAPASALAADFGGPSSASPEAKRARARLRFVAALAEWTNMHDLHKPYAMGPPGKEQRCAHIDDEHSTKERLSCNKLFPRKLVHPGDEEVAEDPVGATCTGSVWRGTATF